MTTSEPTAGGPGTIHPTAASAVAQAAPAAATATASAVASFSPGYKWYVLGLLFLVYVFNFVDRQILAILQESIKQDLGLADWQLGILGGLAFGLFYATLGIPIARLADRWIRTRIIAISLAVWSAMTALCGTATSFMTLALFRVGVGVGEAGCSPPAHSLISDYFPRDQRATALSIYALGIPIGVMVGFMGGAWLDEHYGWRVAFFVAGLPGILLALVVWATLREPPRGMADGTAHLHAQAGEGPGWQEVMRVLWSRRSFRHLSVAGALHAFIGYGVLQFTPSFYIRTHQLTPLEVGTWMALLAGIAGGIGTFMGGAVSDRLAARDARWYMWVPAIATFALAPFAVAQYLVDDPYLSLAAAVIPSILGPIYLGPTLGMTQSLVGVKMRATASAVLLLILNLVGLGLGPLVVGILSDVYDNAFGLGVNSLRWAIVTLYVVPFWATLHYVLAARTLREELATAASEAARA